MSEQSYDQWLMEIPGYARAGFNRSLGRQCWNDSRKQLEAKLAESEKKLEMAKILIQKQHDTLMAVNKDWSDVSKELTESEQKLSEAMEVIRFYNCHISSSTVRAFRLSDEVDSYIGEVPSDDYEILQEGSDSCNLFLGKRARQFLKKHETAEKI